MKAIRIKDNELSHIKKGEVITFIKVLEKTRNVFGDDMWILQLDENGTQYAICPKDYKIEQ